MVPMARNSKRSRLSGARTSLLPFTQQVHFVSAPFTSLFPSEPGSLHHRVSTPLLCFFLGCGIRQSNLKQDLDASRRVLAISRGPDDPRKAGALQSHLSNSLTSVSCRARKYAILFFEPVMIVRHSLVTYAFAPISSKRNETHKPAISLKYCVPVHPFRHAKALRIPYSKQNTPAKTLHKQVRTD